MTYQDIKEHLAGMSPEQLAIPAAGFFQDDETEMTFGVAGIEYVDTALNDGSLVRTPILQLDCLEALSDA